VHSVFISYSSKDAKHALTICRAIEARGADCWISSRDVGPGENFQEAIIAAISQARIMILVFSTNANNSGEIKKELALASQTGLVVIPVRIEDVFPSGAFAYELSTRQWIDLFADWESAMERLTARVATILGTIPDGEALRPRTLPPREPEKRQRRGDDDRDRRDAPIVLIVAALLAMVAGGGGYYWWQSTCCSPPPPISMMPERPTANTDVARRDGTPPQVSGSQQTASENQPEPTPLAPIPQPQPPARENPPRTAQSEPPPNVSEQPRVPENENRPAEAPAPRDVVQIPQPVPGPDPVPVPVPPLATPPVKRQRDEGRTIEVQVSPAPLLAEVGAGGQTFRDCDVCPPMVVVAAGSVWIGSPSSESGHESEEAPRRQTRIAQAFAVGQDAVTFDEWDACVAEGGCGSFIPGDMGWGRGQRPAILVSWRDAKAYAAWLSQKTGEAYRLPSEAEWEYAARACRSANCQDMPFWFGAAINPDAANYDWRYAYRGSQKAQALRRTTPAGSYGPNAFGLFNAVGNVAQWTEDCWNDDLKTLPSDGAPRLSGDCSVRVLRGGSWKDEPIALRSAARKYEAAASRQPNIGFRVVRVLAK
jgi:formylglycine-generating enzyme required for sulfatase activity